MIARTANSNNALRRAPAAVAASLLWTLLLAANQPTARAAEGSPTAGATNAAVGIGPPTEGNAPGAAPAGRPVTREFDKTPIRRALPAAGQGAGPTTAASKPVSGTGPDLVRVGFALAAVLGLIFFLRWGSRRLMNAPSAARTSQAIQVLTRAALSPRQQVVLIQVGRRLLVVADGGTQASALGQITDPDEVAALIGQIRAEKQAGAAASFGSLFGRVRGTFTGDPNGAREDADAAELAGMPSMGGRSYDDADDGEDERYEGGRNRGGRADGRLGISSDADAGDTREVAEARQELSGLMEKVRNLSKQFGRG